LNCAAVTQVIDLQGGADGTDAVLAEDRDDLPVGMPQLDHAPGRINVRWNNSAGHAGAERQPMCDQKTESSARAAVDSGLSRGDFQVRQAEDGALGLVGVTDNFPAMGEDDLLDHR